MKQILSIIAVIIYFHTYAAAQQMNIDKPPVANMKYPIKKHCTTTRVGEGVMLGGASLVAIGTAGYFIDQSSHHTDAYHKGSGMLFVAVGAVGANVALNGLVVFIIGKVYEKNHKDRFSVVSAKNEVGIAWHF